MEATLRRIEVPTEFGAFRAQLSERGVHRLRFPGRNRRLATGALAGDPLAAQLTEELRAYFRAELTTFTVPVDLDQGDAFKRRVWAQLLAIPYGEVTTYGAVAQAIGLAPEAARHVGAAVAGNPVSVIVPCHRVIGSTGALVGFGAGLAWKRRLLTLENPERWPLQEALPGIG
ncbi:MAG: methylated-DNA--[protein]-cysteine S-methyltransferase [Candidatus Dormibacteraeota bacterium]|nr:methylated-DNA--[protein]-cysteine S-methyltransferase [Candidatus Dormibacteraeota bacterium]